MDRGQEGGRRVIGLQLDNESLRPLISAIVREVVEHLDECRERVGGLLAYGEPEAAALISLAPHQLRDARLRGEIQASRGPGGRILYSRDQLIAYLASRPWSPSTARKRGVA